MIASWYDAISNRILALTILFILASWIAGFYWYFFAMNRTSLVLYFTPNTIPVEVTLAGQNTNPASKVLDNVLNLQKNCLNTCTFSPIPPWSYMVTLSISGHIIKTDSISLQIDKENIFTYNVNIPVFIWTGQVLENSKDTIPEQELWSEFLWASFILQKEKVSYFLRKKSKTTEVIIKTPNEVRVYFVVVWENIYSDNSGDFLISQVDTWSYIYSLSNGSSYFFPFSDSISVVRLLPTWFLSIKTKTSVYLFNDSTKQFDLNPYFSDVLELNSNYSIAFIDKNDVIKRTLFNLENENGTVFFLINRTNGERRKVVTTQENVAYLLYDSGMTSFITIDGIQYPIENLPSN